MSFLARFRILTKILAVITLMAIIAGTICWLGISSLNTLNAGAVEMKRASNRALVGARANQNVLTLSRSEFRAALDPRPENRAAVRKIVDQQVKTFQERIDDLSQTRDEKAKALIPAVKESWAAYQKSMETTLRLVDGVNDVKLNDATEKLRDAAMLGRADAEKLQASIRAVSERLTERMEGFAKAASDKYEATSRLLMMVAGIGIVLGLSTGFLIGQFGIARPMRALVGLLQRLAKGEDIEITGTERKDEIGETAQAVNGIKVMLAQKARDDAEVKTKQDQIAAQQRKADMIKLADQFEGAVGEIVETVSSASTELEASASTLTSSAERAQLPPWSAWPRMFSQWHPPPRAEFVRQRDRHAPRGDRHRCVLGPDRRRCGAHQYHCRPATIAGTQPPHRPGRRPRSGGRSGISGTTRDVGGFLEVLSPPSAV